MNAINSSGVRIAKMASSTSSMNFYREKSGERGKSNAAETFAHADAY
jgi:hypothetical protein